MKNLTRCRPVQEPRSSAPDLTRVLLVSE
ncbi:MAG: hypothetical protein K0S37_4433, partial [Microbacterium sp.]|nr:hypothetical protein [Microbacterium sp.]